VADPRAGRGRQQNRSGTTRRGKVDAARLAAFDVLTAVRGQDAYTNLVLPALLRSRGITGRDAAFATELVSGTVRRQGTYDAIIAPNVNRPLSNVEPAVLDALRLGAHQILSMRVPSHAAVGTTVDLVRAKIGHGPAGFVNAVLRTVSAHDLAGWVRRVAPDPGEDAHGFAAVAHSHPRWIVDALASALASTVGDDEALDDLLAADNESPKVTLVALPGLATVSELAAAGGTPSTQSPYAVTLGGGDPHDIAAVAEGRARVQDEGSQLVACGLADAPLDGRDERWLDMCSGPGGKSALLAALAGPRGARVLAVELRPHRSELVAVATASVKGGMLGVVSADGTRPAWRDASFDRVLVDAPCSGLGALRRRPEARWRRTLADLDDLVPLQIALLRSAISAVRPGGVVAYATCSPVLAETCGVVSAVLDGHPDAVLEDAAPLFADLPDLEPRRMPLPGTVQMWPHRQHTDAMFFALLRRR
jgi:16S rRNA (cytosine967-C5)-methyltransferase